MSTKTAQLYAGIAASRRRELPPSLLGELWSGQCAECDTLIVAHAPTLRKYRIVLERLGRELRIVCGPCAHRALAEHGGIELMSFTQEVGRHFIRG